MSRIPRVLLAAATSAVAACGKQNLPSDWLAVPTRASHDRFFPIATGVHAKADCTTCHGTYDTFKKFDCTTCHVEPQIDQLHTGLAGYASDSPSCYGCHPRGTMAAPANHDTAFFPRGSGTAHAGVYCTECHRDLSTPNDPTAFGCYTCHSTLPSGWPHPDPVSGVAILTICTSQTASAPVDVTNPANCLRCHADSQVDAVASHPTSDGTPSQNASHAGAGCLTCHSSMRTDKPFGADFTVTPAVGSGTGCGTCHATLPP